jgi:hypothetical protein
MGIVGEFESFITITAPVDAHRFQGRQTNFTKPVRQNKFAVWCGKSAVNIRTAFS